MNSILKSIVLLLITTSTLFAQETIVIKEVTQTMTKGDNPGLQSTFKSTTTKDIEAAIKSFLSTYKTNIVASETNKSELIADDVMIPSISDNTIDIHYQMLQAGTDVVLTTYYNLGGIWASSTKTPDKYTKVYDLSNKLAGKIMAMSMQKSIDDAGNKVKGLESELKGLESDKTKLANEIESAKKTIANSEKAIAENTSDLTNLKKAETEKVTDIEKEKAALAQFNLTGLQSQVKILEKEKATSQKLVGKNNATIAKNQATISKLITANDQLVSQNKTNEGAVASKTAEITNINGTITTNNLVEREKNLAKLQKEAAKLQSSQEKVTTNTTKTTGNIDESKTLITNNEKAITENIKAQEAKKLAITKAQEELKKLIDTQNLYLSK